MERTELDQFERIISYEFHNKDLLIEALCHSSYVNEQANGVMHDNERLEFLGDAVLNLIVGHILMQLYPDLKEGALSKMRAGLVNDSRLAAIAADIDLGTYVRLGKGEQQTRGRKKKSVLANAFEALLAAVYLDGGFDAAFQMIEIRFAGLFKAISKPAADHDYKTQLQERVQQALGEMPLYRVVSESGPDHEKTFTVRVSVGTQWAEGAGNSKKVAEQNAAKKALELLKNE